MTKKIYAIIMDTEDSCYENELYEEREMAEEVLRRRNRTWRDGKPMFVIEEATLICSPNNEQDPEQNSHS